MYRAHITSPCGCLGADGKPKNAYPTHDEAEAAARRTESRGAPPLRVYECRFGGGFHLTKS